MHLKSLPFVHVALTAQSVLASGLDSQSAKPPTVQVQNGSYYGVHLDTFNQDLFLGIPFAEPPLRDLRFANPESLNKTWSGALPATNYAFVGYSSAINGVLNREANVLTSKRNASGMVVIRLDTNKGKQLLADPEKFGGKLTT